jgi:anti-anti-sigma regulatory factor
MIKPDENPRDSLLQMTIRDEGRSPQSSFLTPLGRKVDMDWNSNLNISFSEVEARVPVTILHIDGRVNMSNSDDLEQAARQAYLKGTRFFLLDLSNVPSLTSAGLRSIHAIYKMASENPSQLAGEAAGSQAPKSPYFKVFTNSPHVLKVLKVAGFDIYMDTYEDLQEALAAF